MIHKMNKPLPKRYENSDLCVPNQRLNIRHIRHIRHINNVTLQYVAVNIIMTYDSDVLNKRHFTRHQGVDDLTFPVQRRIPRRRKNATPDELDVTTFSDVSDVEDLLDDDVLM